jgi:hypothetical protein
MIALPENGPENMLCEQCDLQWLGLTYVYYQILKSKKLLFLKVN